MPKKGPRDLNKKTIPQLQATLWEVFARWVKLNWSVDGAYCNCFTCGKQLEIGTRDCQAGHWIPRTYSPTKYDERNVRPQCGHCNEHRYGAPVEYRANLIDEIGADQVEELEIRSRQRWKWDKQELIEQIKYYRREVADLDWNAHNAEEGT